MKEQVLNALTEARATYVSIRATKYSWSAQAPWNAKIARIDEAIEAAVLLEEPEVPVEEAPAE